MEDHLGEGLSASGIGGDSFDGRPRGFDELGMPFDPEHPPGRPDEDGEQHRGPSGARSEVEDGVPQLRIKQPEHVRDGARLRIRLPVPDRQGHIV